nr:TPA_asm: triple gene block protein 3 [Date palm-associated virus A]DAC85626.1 TPA_asm: triple gene block protein 3 [Date palm-associated virus A]
MFQVSLIIIVTALSVLVMLMLLDSHSKGCTVVITGESVKFINCVFDSEFINYAKSVKPINLGLS